MKPPVARRKTLILLAGLVWSLVGLGLLIAAGIWTRPILNNHHYLWLAAGIFGGVIIHHFGFSRLVAVNIARIFSQAPGKDKVCVFSFQNTRSYFLVIIMIALGYTLRHSPLPKLYLAPIYSAIGFALILSSLLYYRRLRP